MSPPFDPLFDKKASQENPAAALTGAEFWRAVQGGQNVRISADQVRDFVGVGGGGRELFTADRLYYVSPAGDDNNTGSSIGSPVRNAEEIYNRAVTQWDLAGHGLIIQMMDGIHYPPVGAGFAFFNTLHAGGFWTGGGSIIWQGNPADPLAVVCKGVRLDLSGVWMIFWLWEGTILPGPFTIQDMTFQEVSNNLVYLDGTGQVVVNNLNCGAAGFGHLVNNGRARLSVEGAYSILGDAAVHLNSYYSGSELWYYPDTVTAVGTRNFSGSFADCGELGHIDTDSLTFIGTFTGKRFNVYNNGAIQTYGAGLNHFPGTIAGTWSAGGVYGA